MEQPIYKTIDTEFQIFVNNLSELLDGIGNGYIVDLTRIEARSIIYRGADCPQILRYPYNVRYIGKFGGLDNPNYAFLDAHFNMVYTYHGVE